LVAEQVQELGMTDGEKDRGGGISGFGVAKGREAPLSGTGGGAGAGTRAGEGEASGEGIGNEDFGDTDAAKEASALGDFGDHEETPTLEYGEGDRPSGPTIGEALGTGAGMHIGSGTPSDDFGVGGGKPPIDPEENE